MTPTSWRPLWARAARQIIGGRLPSTLVLWEGASRLDGTPIMVVASRINAPSKNGKTGDMVQVSIMRRDLSPIDAWKAGADGAVCPAACVHRSKARGGRGTCYVNKARLGATWRAACRLADAGKVGMPVGLFTGAVVRLGMEGDPSAVPFTAWQEILIGAKRHTGYTADWRRLPRDWSAIFMASCASPADVTDAIAAGWRPFTASASQADDAAYAAAGLKVCASDSVGLSCVRCGGCDGTSRGAKRAGFYLAQHGAIGAAARKKNDACPAASAIVDRIAAARAARA